MVLPKNNYPGTFIVLDGPDGCGKSVQIEMLKEFFRNDSNVVFTKEPGKDRPWGAKIYEELVNEGPDALHKKDPFTFQSWYAYDGKDHADQVIIPALKCGKLVITDRWRSSMNYGAFGPDRVLEINKLMNMNRAILGLSFVWPDALLFFDTATDLCMERLVKKGKKLDVLENRSTIDRVKENFWTFAHLFPHCHMIDGDGSAEEVFQDVQKIVAKVIKNKRPQ